jgi:hypothetical protein
MFDPSTQPSPDQEKGNESLALEVHELVMSAFEDVLESLCQSDYPDLEESVAKSMVLPRLTRFVGRDDAGSLHDIANAYVQLYDKEIQRGFAKGSDADQILQQLGFYKKMCEFKKESPSS